jgi:hypothetical protein
MLLFIPHPLDVGADYMDIRIDSSRFPEYAPRNQIRPLEEIALDLGVPHLSLFDAYREADPNTLYLKGGDDHWNASGQRLAAELVGGYIVRQDPLRVALRADDARIDPRTRP